MSKNKTCMEIVRFMLLTLFISPLVGAVFAENNASQPILRIDAGDHTSKIAEIAADSLGRWLVTASDDQTARVWDLKDGRLIKTLRLPVGGNEDGGHIRAVAITPDGKTVALAASDIYLIDLASGRLIRRMSRSNYAAVFDIDFSPDGRYLAASFGASHGISILSVVDGSVISSLEDTDDTTLSVHFRPDLATSTEQRLVTTSIDGLIRLYRFDGAKLTQLTKSIPPGGKKPATARFSPNGGRIALTFEDSPNVNVLDSDSLKLLFSPDINEVMGSFGSVRWSNDGAALYATGNVAREFPGGAKFFIRRWTGGGAGAYLDLPAAVDVINALAPLQDGRIAFATIEPGWAILEKNGTINVQHSTVIADFRFFKSEFTLSKDASQVRFAYRGGDSPAVFDVRALLFKANDVQGLAGPQTAAIDMIVTNWDDELGIRLNGKELELDEPRERSRSLAMLPKGDGFIFGTDWNLRAIDRSGNERWKWPSPNSVVAVNVSQDGNWVVTASMDGVIRWHRVTDGAEQLAFFPHADQKRWVAWTPSGYYAASPGAEELIGWQLNRYAVESSVLIEQVNDNFPAMKAGVQSDDILLAVNGKTVATSDDAIKVIKSFDTMNNIQLTLLRSGKSIEIIVLPNDDKSENVPRLGVNFNDVRTPMSPDFFPASRFRGQFNRPDILAKILETRDETEAVWSANIYAERIPSDTKVGKILPPVVEIISPSEGYLLSEANLTLSFDARTPEDAPLTGIRLRINGQAVNIPEFRNLQVAAKKGRNEITFPMPPQDSQIQLFAENINGISSPATLRVVWNGIKPVVTPELQFKPKLYVLAVGVSLYANPDYNLGLAAKDATDMADVFLQQKGHLFEDVQVRLLTNSKASKDDVLDGLEWLKREVTARDVGVMFLAGHGMNDNTGKYFFLPHNADSDKLLRTGVPQSDIKDTLNSLAGKAIFFVDTCHSGNALGTAKTRATGSVTDAFVNELASAENGIVVFAASTGRQFSQENPVWGNGAFTKAVVEGLNGRADFQKTGRITHKGLDYYVSERVKELTKGTQSPVSIAPQGVTDFPIAVVRQ